MTPPKIKLGFKLSELETSFFYKNRPKTRVFTQKRVRKNYETGENCERVS